MTELGAENAKAYAKKKKQKTYPTLGTPSLAIASPTFGSGSLPFRLTGNNRCMKKREPHVQELGVSKKASTRERTISGGRRQSLETYTGNSKRRPTTFATLAPSPTVRAEHTEVDAMLFASTAFGGTQRVEQLRSLLQGAGFFP